MDANFAGAQSPLLRSFVAGVVDYRGRPVLRSKSGSWRSAYFIIGVEVAERFAYYGISSNLIMYLTGPLGQSTATAAENVNVWTGTASLLPLVGAFVADAFLGRYLTITIASLLYILALGLLALSTLLPSDCETATVGASSCSPRLQVVTFFISLYLLALAQGGHKPCVQAFGADQFDSDNPEECKAKSSFFNWWYFGLCAGPTVGIFVVSYIQDTLSWALGFGIPCIIMGLALLIFLSGTTTYRFAEKTEEKSPFTRIGRVFVKAARNWRITPSAVEQECGTFPDQDSQQFSGKGVDVIRGEHRNRVPVFGTGTAMEPPVPEPEPIFLNKALVSPNGSEEDRTICSLDEVEEAKSVLRLVPIWASCLGYAIVFAQAGTLFTKQGSTMDRSIGPSFKIPPATLQSFIGLSIIIIIPIYDTLFVPLARSLTTRPSGITTLQRIGTGIVLSILSMVVAGFVEMKRLETAREYGLADDPGAVIPMKIWWLLPQCLLSGAGDVFTIVGMQEFFYDQVPSDLRSIGLALYLSVLGVGSFMSGFLIFVVEKTTGGNGEDGWISDNMNRGHIDYFYYLLAGISAGAFVIYIYAAKSYVYNRGTAL
ncbi:hypothetical protein OSB04_005065 [Centaurea solstitialis]|uniref:Uncharacterized protein n=1 Tax=Centaurea solstitialis TaxID=347529 RepID=A0AA38TF94_9ASTR|nr:hypothetical protein OSB04_005065 [Centaurea solstitialis]